jgi:hypothetical protein
MAFRDEQRRAVDRIIALAWQDETFKQQLITDPMRVLSATGLQLPSNIEYRVVENTATVQYLVIPAKPVGPVVGEIVEDPVRSAAAKKNGTTGIKGGGATAGIRGGPPKRPGKKRPRPGGGRKGGKRQPKRGRKQGGRKGGGARKSR